MVFSLLGSSMEGQSLPRRWWKINAKSQSFWQGRPSLPIGQTNSDILLYTIVIFQFAIENRHAMSMWILVFIIYKWAMFHSYVESSAYHLMVLFQCVDFWTASQSFLFPWMFHPIPSFVLQEKSETIDLSFWPFHPQNAHSYWSYGHRNRWFTNW